MSGDKNLALVLKMGSPRELGYNPIAPRSHRWMMDISQRDEVVRLVGWALWRTVDRDPEGKYGPIKKTRTHIAHDDRCVGTKHKFLGIEHAADDLGMTVANAIDALRRAVEQGKLLVDEDGRISPNGNAPEPRRTKRETKTQEQQDEIRKENEVFFCTENMPPSLIERFQQLSINETTQYRLLYSKIPEPLAQRLKKLAPEQRTTDTWRLLEGLEYREQLQADAMAISRRAGDYVVDQIYSELGHKDEERRGRDKRDLDDVTVELKARVSFREFSVQKKAKKEQDSVQNGKPILNRKRKDAVQKQASLFDFSEFYRPSSEKDFTVSESPSSSSFSSLVGAELRKHGAVDDDVLTQLINGCRTNAPDCTAQEICYFIAEKAKLFNRQTRNPVMVLTVAVPKCFKGESFHVYRAESIHQKEIEERDRMGWAEPRSVFEAQLKDPRVDEQAKAEIRRILSRAESEGKAKTKAAGQG